ncbi:uncharacterized protein LOC131526126 [Onychostoma macrolepis]|uniref:uncharacterized protein LOC131526126 n=1 Tax=Onychostoma macrolepis TaxID=369639 RepID=UPI00272B67E6|nr:uncharacterized protein LOC131526126 [Onychostoma macrolepis]
MDHFRTTMKSAPLDLNGDTNTYCTPTFISRLTKYFLPHAVLWSGMMLGDLERHGTRQAYQNLTKLYNKVKQSKKQNFTEDNRTQGIMEKSQWDLKRIRLQRRQFTRLDDFVRVYQKMHDALLLEYGDMERSRKKSFQVEEEVWRKTQKRTGLYVSPLVLDLSLKKQRENFSQQQPQIAEEQNTVIIQTQATSDFTEHQEEDTKRSTTQRTNDAQSQLTALWGKNNTEVVVSVVLSQFRKKLLVHHSELLSLRPHNWLTGEDIEYFLHHTVNRLHLEKTIYVLDHYTATVILFKNRITVRKHSLPKYISAADVQMHRVYLVDPSSNAAEEADSEVAAQKFILMQFSSFNLIIYTASM